MNIIHVPKKTTVSPDTPSFGIEFEFLIAVLAKPSIENPNPSDPRTVYFPSTPEDNAPSYFQIPVGKEDWANEWSIYAHIKRSLASIGLPTEPGKANSNFAVWEVTADGSIQGPPPPSRRDKKAYADWQAYTYYPIEIRTPAYYYGEDALRDISDFCAIMRRNYLVTVNKSCGLHVHIGYGTQGFTLPHLRRLGAIIEAFEPQFDSIHPEHRIDSRNAHCVSLRRNTFFQYQYRQDHGRAPRVLETIATLLACESGDAFHTCVASEATTGAYAFVGEKTAWNFDRMGTESKRREEHVPDTVEFRGHEGSLDAEAVGNWVRVLVGVVEYTRKVDAWGFGELLSRVREESWELGERDQRVTGQGRYEPGGVMYKPVFGEEWCGLVDLLRVLKINGPALYYENRKGRWLENGVYNHWYTHAPSEYVVNPAHEDRDASNDDNDKGENDKSSPPSKRPSGSESSRFDPFNPNPIPITPEKPVEKPEGKKTTPVDLTNFDIDTRFSYHSSSPTKKVSTPVPSSAKPSSKKSDSPDSFPMRPNPGKAIDADRSASNISPEKPDIAVPYPDTPEHKSKPAPHTGFKVPSSSPTTNSSTKSVSLALSHYEREAVKARAVAAKFWEEERKRVREEAEKEVEKRAKAVAEKTKNNRKKSSMDLGSEQAMSPRSAGSASAVEFTDTRAREEEEVWEPQGWKGADSDATSEETKVFAEAKKLAEEQERLEQKIRNLKPGIGYLRPVCHPPLRTLPGPIEYSHRTQNQHSHLLQGTPPAEIEALAPNTSNFLGRPFHRAFRAPSTPWLEDAPSGSGMNPRRMPYPGPVPIIEGDRIAMLDDALNSTIGEPWIWDHGLRTRSAGLQHMLRGHQLYEVSPTVKARLLAYNNLILEHHTHGRSVHQLFPARAHNVAQFEAADDRWWRGQIAEGEIVKLERQAADSDENTALTALETLDSMRTGEQYFYVPAGVQNPFASGLRTQAQIEEDISPSAGAPIPLSGPDTPAPSAVPAEPRNPRTEERNHFRKVQEDAHRAMQELEEAEEAAARGEMERYEAEKARRMEIAMAMILKARAEAAAAEEEEEEGEDTTRVAPEPQNSWERGDEGGLGSV